VNINLRKPKSTTAFAITLLGAGALLFALVMLPKLREPSLPDFAAIEDVDTLKRQFFSFLAPQVDAVNARVRAQRARLLPLAEAIEHGHSPRWRDRRWLRSLAREYQVELDPAAPEEALALLRLRVDSVPVPLALVQAAAESGWGRSRFAVEGNNLFGHWCYVPGCGLVPESRGAKARHEVAVFGSVREAARRYLHNLNTHPAYRPLRERREALRRQGRPLETLALVDGLLDYSERREAYIEEIRALLEFNRELIEDATGSS